jgi:hypothetical protein
VARSIGFWIFDFGLTDAKSQGYTTRLRINDKLVELKDRALNKAIQFHHSVAKILSELVVSEIGEEAVSGRLALPQTTPTRQS